MIYCNPLIFGIFVGFMVLGYIYFLMTAQNRSNAMAGPGMDLN